MFSCYVHGWSSLRDMCPKCDNGITYSSTSSGSAWCPKCCSNYSFFEEHKCAVQSTYRITSPMEVKKERKVKYYAYLKELHASSGPFLAIAYSPPNEPVHSNKMLLPQFDIYEEE